MKVVFVKNLLTSEYVVNLWNLLYSSAQRWKQVANKNPIMTYICNRCSGMRIFEQGHQQDTCEVSDCLPLPQ